MLSNSVGDEQFVERIRQRSARRRIHGVSLLLLGLLCVVTAIVTFSHLRGQAKAVLALPDEITLNPGIIDETMLMSAAETSFVVGSMLGFLSGKLAVVGVYSILFGA